MAPDVTLLVPNYNGARYLGETLQSLLAQTYNNFQVILIDNVSTDNSIDLALKLKDPRLKIMRATKYVSMAANWNRAVECVETEFFSLCHSDDIYTPGYLAQLVPIMRRRPKAFIVHCKARSIDESGNFIKAPAEDFKDTYWPDEEPYQRAIVDELKTLQRGDYIMAPSPLYRTSAVRAIGPFSEKFHMVTDWEYWFRGLLAGYTIVGTHNRLLHYRRHASSDTKKHEASLRRFKEELEICAWIALEAKAARLIPDAQPDYSLVMNTVLSDFAARLNRGDLEGAASLHEFARSDIPGFRNSPRDLLMNSARGFGKFAGWSLLRAQRAYVFFSRMMR